MALILLGKEDEGLARWSGGVLGGKVDVLPGMGATVVRGFLNRKAEVITEAAHKLMDDVAVLATYNAERPTRS